MLRMVFGVLLVVVLSVIVTLGVVNIVQVKNIEKQFDAVIKKIDNASEHPMDRFRYPEYCPK